MPSLQAGAVRAAPPGLRAEPGGQFTALLRGRQGLEFQRPPHEGVQEAGLNLPEFTPRLNYLPNSLKGKNRPYSYA